MFRSKRVWVKHNFGLNNILIKGLQKIGSKKFGQNWVSNSFDIFYMANVAKRNVAWTNHDSWHL